MAGRGTLCGGWNRCAYVLFAIYVNGTGGQAASGTPAGKCFGAFFRGVGCYTFPLRWLRRHRKT